MCQTRQQQSFSPASLILVVLSLILISKWIWKQEQSTIRPAEDKLTSQTNVFVREQKAKNRRTLTDLSVSAGGRSVSGASAGVPVHQRRRAAARSSEETQRRSEPREPAAEAPAAAPPGRHGGQRRTPRTDAGPGPAGPRRTPSGAAGHRSCSRCSTLSVGLQLESKEAKQ